MIVQISKLRSFIAAAVMAIAFACIWLLMTNHSIMGGELSGPPTRPVVTETVTHVMWVDPATMCTAQRQEGYAEQCKQE
jgi:hypothetical protein